MVIAEFGVGQVLWSFLWLFLFLLYISLVITIFADIIRSDDLSGPAKAAWALVILVLPYLGVIVYLVVRGSSINSRVPRRSHSIYEDYLPGAGAPYY